MNSLVILPQELLENQVILLLGGRADDFLREYRSVDEDSLKFAIWGGDRGVAHIVSTSPGRVELRVERTEPSIPLEPIDLIVGLPRPQTVKKVIQAAVTFGVRSLHFVHTRFGEKSYLTSQALFDENVEAEIVKSLEQIWNGLYPEVRTHRSFRYFCDQHLQLIGAGDETIRYIAQPGGSCVGFRDADDGKGAHVIAIGCERGWSNEELQAFSDVGFQSVGLGPRVMRVELAVVCLLGQLQLLAAI